MVYIPKFTIKINQMLVNMPCMDAVGYLKEKEDTMFSFFLRGEGGGEFKAFFFCPGVHVLLFGCSFLHRVQTKSELLREQVPNESWPKLKKKKL